MWDVWGDSFDSLSGVGLLEVAELSIDEPELQAVSFGLGDAEVEVVEETGNEEEAYVDGLMLVCYCLLIIS